MASRDWKIYTGKAAEGDEQSNGRRRTQSMDDVPPDVPLKGVPVAPPWRQFGNKQRDEQHGRTFLPTAEAIEMVNAALYLRRPLLVTGKPGTGKSSLARAVACELGLGRVLEWPINTRSTLQEGLYRYDAIARLRDAQLYAHDSEHTRDKETAQQIGRYIHLGPLGTALLPRKRPRVLLIDEIDKSDIDLPNDLLHVFEEGWFSIPELTRQRLAQAPTNEEARRKPQEPVPVEVTTDDNQAVTVLDGAINCDAFPFVVLTSNGERDFPPAFLRRCLRLNMDPPSPPELEKIVARHLGNELYTKSATLISDQIRKFVKERDNAKGDLATDQLLNLIYMLTRDVAMDDGVADRLAQVLKQKLSTD